MQLKEAMQIVKGLAIISGDEGYTFDLGEGRDIVLKFTNVRSGDGEVITYYLKEDAFFVYVEGSSSGEGGYYDFSIKVPESFMEKVRNTFKKATDNKIY